MRSTVLPRFQIQHRKGSFVVIDNGDIRCGVPFVRGSFVPSSWQQAAYALKRAVEWAGMLNREAR